MNPIDEANKQMEHVAKLMELAKQTERENNIKICEDEKPKFCPFCAFIYGNCDCPRDKLLEYSRLRINSIISRIKENK